MPLRIDAVLVIAEHLDFVRFEELYLGDANAMLAGNDPSQGLGQRHDARNCCIRSLQHLVVVGIHRNVGVDITIPGMHVQSHEHPTTQHLLMRRITALKDAAERDAGKNPLKLRADFLLPAYSKRMVLNQHEHRLCLGRRGGGRGHAGDTRIAGNVGLGSVQIVQQVAPAFACA